MSGDKWSKDVLAFFNNSISSTSASTTITSNDAMQGFPADTWEEDFEHALEDGVDGPVFHTNAPGPALSLPPNEPLPSINNAKTNSTATAAQIRPSESISTAMQDLVLGLDTQDQVVSVHDTNTDVIADTTTKPKPKPRPKLKHGKGKAALDGDLELTEVCSNTWKSSRKR
jgi:hypothetical protein